MTKASNRLRRTLNTKFQAKQDLIDARPGQLGDGYGHISVTGREHYVYVRVAGIVDEVFNNRVPAENDLLVIVGFDPAQPNLYQVLSTRTASPGGLTGGALSGYAPAIRYQWMASGGGQDPLFVEKRQFLPLRIGVYSGMLIQVYRDIIWTGTDWVAVNTQTVDLTSYIPATAGKAALVLITLNSSGAVVATKGSEVDIADLAIGDIPDVPAGTREVLGAVRVYNGQTAVQEARTNTDIVDLRLSGWSAESQGGGTDSLYPSNATITTDGIVGGDDDWVNGATQRVSAVVSKTVAGTTYQVYAFWDSDGYLCFAKRNISTTTWTIYTTAIQIGGTWDAHNTINLGLDEDGYIHVAYDNHDTPLKYRKSTLPISTFAGVLSSTLAMVGTHETELTYPMFVNDPAGALYVTFRDGAVGYGDQYMYKYDHDTTTWAAVTGSGAAGIIIDGKTDGLGVYVWEPCFDSNFGSGGFMHVFWTWNPDPGNDKDFDIAHMRWDGTNWTTAAGAAQPMPADSDNYTQVLNLPVGSGILHQGHSASDSTGHPHLAYIRQGTDTYYHIFHLWYNGATWVDLQITTTAWNVWATNIRPDIAIDRATDKVYIIYVDALERAGLLAKVSGAGDYTTWSSHRLWGGVVGYYEPTHDPQQWAENTTLYIPVANDDTGVITMVAYQVTPAAFHHITHEAGGTDEIDLNGLVGRAATSQYITIQDEGVSQGQAHTLNLEGGASVVVAAGVGTLTLNRWEPLTNGDPDNPEIIFDGGDVLMVEVSS